MQSAGLANPRAASHSTRSARTWLGGFNLLPYRQRNARRARRQRLLEWLGAVLAGCSAVLVFAGWQTWSSARLDAQRAVIERSLSQLRAPVAEHAALLKAADEERRAEALAKGLSEPLTHLRDLLEALSFEPGEGVVLQRLRQRNDATELLATSPGHAASAEWLKRLSAVRGVKDVEMNELHPVTARGAGAPNTFSGAAKSAAASTVASTTTSAAARTSPAPAGSIEFGAHLRWRDPAQKPPAAAESRAVKNRLSGDH
ncbi:fimbrial assembly protein [Paraburkholderia sp. PREW-6R]|uniref:fimbrial assembly protein n=1 Tax=Paraburkholderia sp. PREW-6R TaxID=3141544 RepID=UPI0031F5B916